jgi:hypothetical protein
MKLREPQAADDFLTNCATISVSARMFLSVIISFPVPYVNTEEYLFAPLY